MRGLGDMRSDGRTQRRQYAPQFFFFFGEHKNVHHFKVANRNFTMYGGSRVLSCPQHFYLGPFSITIDVDRRLRYRYVWWYRNTIEKCINLKESKIQSNKSYSINVQYDFWIIKKQINIINAKWMILLSFICQNSITASFNLGVFLSKVILFICLCIILQDSVEICYWFHYL
jgi:hypothetical protein